MQTSGLSIPAAKKTNRATCNTEAKGEKQQTTTHAFFLKQGDENKHENRRR
jgi:hypothetical protein